MEVGIGLFIKIRYIDPLVIGITHDFFYGNRDDLNILITFENDTGGSGNSFKRSSGRNRDKFPGCYLDVYPGRGCRPAFDSQEIKVLEEMPLRNDIQTVKLHLRQPGKKPH